MYRLLLGRLIAFMLVVFPVLVLFLTQGILNLYQQGVAKPAIVIACSAFLISTAVVVWIYVSRRRAGSIEHNVVDMVDANPAWGAQQEQVWSEVCAFIDDLLEKDERVEVLLDHSLTVLRQVAKEWNSSSNHLEYAVTLPEALLATETLAARYRKVLLANIPLANRIKVSQALSMWEFYERHETKITYSKWAYRLYRMTSVAGLLSELGTQLTNGLSDHAQKNLLYNLKRAYLQEVANVAIDLYSGNFRRAMDELPFEQDQQRDLERLAAEVGPIRIVIVGQISSGKSTLTNAVLEEFKAESGLVPTTEEDTVYQFSLAGGLDTHIIDTPGIESDTKSIDVALSRLKDADLVIWVMRANQPGRNIDQQLYSAYEQYFESTPHRQRPAILLAATHIDCIQSFAGVSEDTLQEVTAPLATACGKVVRYEVFCPLALDGQELGLGELRNALAELYKRAINTRLNRVRMNKPTSYQAASEELAHLGAGTVKALKLSWRKGSHAAESKDQ